MSEYALVCIFWLGLAGVLAAFAGFAVVAVPTLGLLFAVGCGVCLTIGGVYAVWGDQDEA